MTEKSYLEAVADWIYTASLDELERTYLDPEREEKVNKMIEKQLDRRVKLHEVDNKKAGSTPIKERG